MQFWKKTLSLFKTRNIRFFFQIYDLQGQIYENQLLQKCVFWKYFKLAVFFGNRFNPDHANKI